ncbi:PP2C family protein-serine/threonine phosphatase [Longispora albida]|uniref:PP2C family protein-serine/threonine phosphatase n=1 Tax=Longispora albida TaxID=203523 RepID=UPI00047652D2|nr:PP2C family serine/threonine-protein phosphatase [Longispora albida]
MTLTLRYAARSDRGLIRDGNQDSVYAGPRLLAVADGMGGMAAGDVASNIVIGVLAPLDEDVPGNDLVEPLRRAVEAANQRLRATVEANPQLEGMGTTLTGMLFSGSRFGMVHIGDSRAYLLRDGEFAQITKDDTYVQMLVDEGRITAEEAGSHPQRSLLTRALDGRDVDPEFSVRQARPGDRYLICSDGLSGVVSAETIGDTLREMADPAQCMERLIQLALRGGGPDNITVIIADLTDSDIVEGTPIVGGAAARDRGDVTQQIDLTSSAGRAAALALPPPRPAAPEEPLAAVAGDEDEGPKRHPVRNTLLILLAVVVLAGAGLGTWFFTQAQYYVGVTDSGQVAIFKGVPGSFAGLKLSRVDVVSERRVEDLTPQVQEKVRKGVQFEDLKNAQALLAELSNDDATNDKLIPVCPSPVTPTPTPVPSSPAPVPSGTPSVVPTPGTTGSPAPAVSATASASASATAETPRDIPNPCRTRK